MSSRKLSLRMDQEVRDAFHLFDQDGDGRVTKREITDLIQSLEGDPNCPHVQVRVEVCLFQLLRVQSHQTQEFQWLFVCCTKVRTWVQILGTTRMVDIADATPVIDFVSLT